MYIFVCRYIFSFILRLLLGWSHVPPLCSHIQGSVQTPRVVMEALAAGQQKRFANHTSLWSGISFFFLSAGRSIRSLSTCLTMKGQHVRTVISPSRVGGRHNLDGEKKREADFVWARDDDANIYQKKCVFMMETEGEWKQEGMCVWGGSERGRVYFPGCLTHFSSGLVATQVVKRLLGVSRCRRTAKPRWFPPTACNSSTHSFISRVAQPTETRGMMEGEAF